MLSFSSVFSSYSVNNLQEAKLFYRDVLGLQIEEVPPPMSILKLKIPNGYTVMLYPKNDHQPATFTVLNFNVQDVEQAVDHLITQGITFEQYTGEIATDAKGIMRGNGPTIAWFKDPAGNILSLIQE